MKKSALDVPTYEKELFEIIRPVLERQGYFLLKTKITLGGRYPIFHITANRKDGKQMTVHDCVIVNQAVKKMVLDKNFCLIPFTIEVGSLEEKTLLRAGGKERTTHVTVLREDVNEKKTAKVFRGNIERISKHSETKTGMKEVGEKQRERLVEKELHSSADISKELL